MEKIVVIIALIIGSYIDIRKREIPVLFFWIFFLGLIPLAGYRSFAGETELLITIGTGIIPGLLLCLISKLSGESIGMGDAYFLGIAGCYLGWKQLVLPVALSCFLLGLYSIGLLMVKKANRKTEIPYLPFLLLGSTTFLI